MKTVTPPDSAVWLTVADAAASAGAHFLAIGADMFARSARFQLELAGNAAKAGQAQMEALGALTEPGWYLRRIEPALEQAKTDLALMTGGPEQAVHFPE